jgi:hypothetical protein
MPPHEFRDPDAAVREAQAAVERLRGLPVERYRKGLIPALEKLCAVYERGWTRSWDALRVADEITAHYRILAEEQPDRYLVRLARGLDRSIRYRKEHKHEDGDDQDCCVNLHGLLRESAWTYRRLVHTAPTHDHFEHFAVRLLKVTSRGDVPASMTACDIADLEFCLAYSADHPLRTVRRLAERQALLKTRLATEGQAVEAAFLDMAPNPPVAELGRLDFLGDRLADLSTAFLHAQDPEKAAQYAAWDVEVRRRLAEARPQYHRLRLADKLLAHGRVRITLGDTAAAADALREAEALYSAATVPNTVQERLSEVRRLLGDLQEPPDARLP